VVYLYGGPDVSPPGFEERLHSQARAMNTQWQLVAMPDPSSVAHAFAAFGRGTNGLLLDYSSPILRTADQVCRLALQRGYPQQG
jgi:hypothetical protein